MRIRDAIDGFVLTLQASRASPNTVRLYQGMLNRLATFAEGRGRTRLDELTIEVVRSAVVTVMSDRQNGAEDDRAANWKGGEASAYALVCAARAFSTALRGDGVAVADFNTIRLPSLPERVQPRLTADEFRALEAAALRRLMSGRAPRFLVARDLALLSFMADTGLRAIEISRLNLEDLDLVIGSVAVQGKGDKPRVLNLRDTDPAERDGGPTLRALRDYLAQRAQTFGRNPRQRALWLNRRGDRLSPGALREELAKLCDEAGIDGNRPPHAFRRGYFSAEYRARPTALPVLKARMGWSPKSHEMVEVYTRGAEIDLAREQPQPSVSKRWREGGRKVPSPQRFTEPMLDWGVGPPRASGDDAPPPRRGRKDGERAAGQPTKGRRPNNTRTVNGS